MTTLRDLLIARAVDDRRPGPAHPAEVLDLEAVRRAGRPARGRRTPPPGPGSTPARGVLLDNTPTTAFQLAAAGLGGHVLVGLNTTRRAACLARDVATAGCQVVRVSTRARRGTAYC